MSLLSSSFFSLSCMLFFFFSSCGYHFEGGSTSAWKTTVSIPYVQNDYEGRLTDALVRAMGSSGSLEYQHYDGRLILNATVINGSDDRIGFRYDRDDISGKRRRNLIGVENRKGISVEVKLVDAQTHKVIFGPEIVHADVEYDYYDYNSLKDLSFIDKKGIRRSSVQFSLGQLDSQDAATMDALTPLYHLIAQKIVDGIIASHCKVCKEKKVSIDVSQQTNFDHPDLVDPKESLH